MRSDSVFSANSLQAFLSLILLCGAALALSIAGVGPNPATAETVVTTCSLTASEPTTCGVMYNCTPVGR